MQTEEPEREYRGAHRRRDEGQVVDDDRWESIEDWYERTYDEHWSGKYGGC